MITDNTRSKNAKVCGLPFGSVRFTGGLMREISERIMNRTVPQLKRMFDDKDISHAVENFRICAGEAEGGFDGSVFCDGDFYKFLEAAVYTAYTQEPGEAVCTGKESKDPLFKGKKAGGAVSAKQGNGEDLKEQIEEYISLIQRAQQPDGYLSTKQILGERDGSAQRNSDINDFEVYNMGHLFTSACLHYRLSGKTGFLEVAKKAAGYLEKLYGESEKTGEVRTAVCPSHYMGLLELYRTTGEERYLRLAKKAIELRDSVKDGLDDNQDRLPLKSHRKIIGHAVRANYLYAGLADLCAEIDDPDYERVLHSVWRDLATKKLYITGGCGALYNGASPYGNFFHHQLIHQAYGYEYQLPNITAYNETCASVGLVMWAYRMFQIDPKAEYFDMIERAWLNVNLASVSLDGLRFFYENMLRRERQLDYELIWPLERTDYLISYCCPPNIARQLAQSAEYAYETDREGNIWVGLYGENEAVVREPENEVILCQKTAYPYDGRILFEIESSRSFFLYLRIPSWCLSGRIDGRELKKEELGTYVKVPVSEGKSRVELVLNMPVTLVRANPMIEETTGQLAVTKGPLVYCLENITSEPQKDNAPENRNEVSIRDQDYSLNQIWFNPNREFTEGYVEIEGIRIPTLKTVGSYRRNREKTESYETPDYLAGPLYEPFDPKAVESREVPLRFIPYFAWDNRGRGEMRVWIQSIY